MYGINLKVSLKSAQLHVLQKNNTKVFFICQKKQFKLHTKGHADIGTLKEMKIAIKPKTIVPIHTFKGKEYTKHFDYPVLEIKDG